MWQGHPDKTNKVEKYVKYNQTNKLVYKVVHYGSRFWEKQIVRPWPSSELCKIQLFHAWQIKK